jgi:putative endonuclease
MLNSRQQYGHKSESAAVDFLQRNGYRILTRNYRTRLGEIDIIAKDGQTIVFVEVKARRSNRYGLAKAAVTPAKQRKISMVALQYLKEARLADTSARFDVVAIYNRNNSSRIEIIKNAFELAYA